MIAETTIAISMATLAIILLAVAILKNSGQSSFLYANARVVARTLHIIDKPKIEQLISSNTLPEFINSLKDTEYYQQLETVDKNNMTEFNMALEEGLINSINDVKKISPEKFREIFDVYTKLFESKIIKTFFRSRFSDTHIERKLIEPIGGINPVLLKHLHETKTIADIKLVLRDTDYKELFEREYRTIEEFDFALEKSMIKDINNTLKSIRTYDGKALMEIFRKKREVKEILMLLKFRIRNKDIKDIPIELQKIDIRRLSQAQDLKSFVECFASSDYYDAMKKGMEDFQKYDNYYSFEKELLKHYYDFVTGNDLIHTIGPYPIISYITKKEIEQKNLLIIAKGIISGLGKDELKRMVI